MSEQTMTIQSPSRGPINCMGCGSPMAPDQKYCLDCGKRKGEPRVEYSRYLPEAAGEGAGTPPPVLPPGDPVGSDSRPEREVTPLMAAAGLAGLAMILLLGVLIGRMGQNDSAPVVAATGLPTATTASTGTTGTEMAVSFQSDWPSGEDGWTVELATVSNTTDAAAVEATKTDLASKGASEVGVLNSDDFGTLPVGNYVFFSGKFPSKEDAEAELETLSTSFPDARVIEVASDGGGSGAETVKSSGSLASDANAAQSPDKVVEASKAQLDEINNADAGDYQELQKKLPPTIATPGKAPPKDNKKPGAGSDAVSIG